MRKKSECSVVILGVLLLVAFAHSGCAGGPATMEEKSVVKYVVLPSGPETIEVAIHSVENGEYECDANPDPTVRRNYETVKFTNTMSENVTLVFDVDVQWGDQVTTKVEVQPEIPEFVRVPASTGAAIEENPFNVVTKGGTCSPEDQQARPRIIIPPSQ